MLRAVVAVIKIGLDPVMIHVGPFSIHWYGVMYVVGIVAGLYFSIPYAERLGMSRDTYYEIFWPVVIGSLIGGRLYYVVQSDLGHYLQHADQILATWEGGMAFYGAVFLGGAAGFVASRLKQVSFALVLDVAAVFIPIAQAIGRIGNIINGDIVGYPSSLPWATQYTNANNTFAPSRIVAYDPAAAYELLFSLALFGLVMYLRHRFRVPGTLFFTWLTLYAIGQFFLFFDRANVVVALDLKQAQLTSIAVLVVAVPAYFVWRRYWLRRAELRAMSVPRGGAPDSAEATAGT